MQPRWAVRFVIRIEVAGAATRRDLRDRGPGCHIELRRGELGHRGQPLVGVELAPTLVRPQ
ncbi:Uncharacterised protein [Mycobacterium tuberculosis]|nr:Uncharacterised protein [Mycobacterium tuberculosis]